MSRSGILLLLVAIAYIGLSSGAIVCPANEEFKLCGTKCEPTCAIKHFPNCLQACVTACQCKKGFYRNAHKHCVSEKNC
ncbi:chymotrypsin inhibitor-like [Andrena cerasifolii]|uniref:chymotrypsin inhibitor-like n=1 Tax=Andrena cerasifolii TaxID=2819439 RepID=UPI004037863F